MPGRTSTAAHADQEEEEQTAESGHTIADAQMQVKEVPGPITRAYRADPKKVAQRLNQLRSTEIVSYLQYKQHAYMIVSLVGPGVKGEFLEHAEQELHHADMLAERIEQLGGTPVYDLNEIAKLAAQQHVSPDAGKTVEQMVMEDLEIERIQCERYTEAVREVGFDDPVTRRMLEDILKDTEHHAAELRDMLQHRA